jgi:hypothetical protein
MGLRRAKDEIQPDADLTGQLLEQDLHLAAIPLSP